MAKPKTVPQGDDQAAVQKPARSRRKMVIVGALAAISVTSLTAGGYLALRSANAGEGAAAHGEAAASEIPVPMPASMLAASTASKRAADYQIVSVFEDEAILAAGDNLLRVKVGSDISGLGTITAIEPAGNGSGAVIGTAATLRSL